MVTTSTTVVVSHSVIWSPTSLSSSSNQHQHNYRELPSIYYSTCLQKRSLNRNGFTQDMLRCRECYRSLVAAITGYFNRISYYLTCSSALSSCCNNRHKSNVIEIIANIHHWKELNTGVGTALCIVTSWWECLATQTWVPLSCRNLLALIPSTDRANAVTPTMSFCTISVCNAILLTL